MAPPVLPVLGLHFLDDAEHDAPAAAAPLAAPVITADAPDADLDSMSWGASTPAASTAPDAAMTAAFGHFVDD